MVASHRRSVKDANRETRNISGRLDHYAGQCRSGVAASMSCQAKHQAMNNVSIAQSRLAIARAVGNVPRFLNPERGFATDLLISNEYPIDPKKLLN